MEGHNILWKIRKLTLDIIALHFYTVKTHVEFHLRDLTIWKQNLIVWKTGIVHLTLENYICTFEVSMEHVYSAALPSSCGIFKILNRNPDAMLIRLSDIYHMKMHSNIWIFTFKQLVVFHKYRLVWPRDLEGRKMTITQIYACILCYFILKIVAFDVPS